MGDIYKLDHFGKTELLYLITLIHTELGKYVKAVEGKGLSTNDLTDELFEKLNTLDVDVFAQLTGAEFTGEVKIPTASKGTNSTVAASTAYVVSAIQDAISGITGISFDGPYDSYESLVSTVTEPGNGVIYLVKNNGSTPNAQDEYFWNGENFELFGSITVDLSGYLKIENIDEIGETEVQAAWDSVFTS